MRVGLFAAFAVVTLVFLVYTARAIEAKITWYLAVDQFGYLQFAHDLLDGKIFHEWAPARALAKILPKRTDVLAQTYVWDNGTMYCRYAPGFPMLLAGWIAVFGDLGAPLLNPTVYFLLLVVMIAFTWRLTHSPWRGLMAATLIVLCPTQMHFWALTLTRDLSAHLFAFTGLFLLLPHRGRLGVRRVLLAALPLGFAASIRNDAVLYLIAAGFIVGVRWTRERPPVRRALRQVAAGFAGVVLGLLPTLSFNAVATGNPLRPTQGMELESFLPSPSPPAAERSPKVGYPSPGWKGGTHTFVQGGGLRLSNLPNTIRGNWAQVLSSYGPSLLGIAALGAAAALVTRPVLALAAVPYMLTAFLFFSCWSRPDRRYLIGVYLFMPLLITEGVCGPVDLVRRLARSWGEDSARALGVGLALGGVAAAVWFSPLVTTPEPAAAKSALPVLGWVLPLALGVGGIGAALAPKVRITAVVAPALATAIAIYGAARAEDGAAARAAFQKPQMLRARETFRKAVEPGSVVITTEDIGRPAENIEYYSGVAQALYLTDLARWHVSAPAAAVSLIGGGMRPYVLIHTAAPERERLVAELNANGLVAERVLTIPPNRNMEYFVAAPFHRGLPLELYRVTSPVLERILREKNLPRPGA